MRFTRFARRYLAPYWHWYLAGTLMLLATNQAAVTIPVVLASGVDGLVDGNHQAVGRAAAIIGALGVGMILVRTLSRVLFFTPGRLVQAQVQRDLLGAVLKQQPSFLSQFNQGDLFSRFSADVNMLRLLAGFALLQLVNTVIAITLAGRQMAVLDLGLALWLIAPVLVGFGFTQLLIRRMFVLMRRAQEQLASLSDHILASYRGVSTVRAFQAEDAFRAEFDDRNTAYLGTVLERATWRTAISPSLALAATVDVFLLLWIGGPKVIAGELTVGDLVAFIALVNFITMPLRGTSFLISLLKQAQVGLERVDTILYGDVERPDLVGTTTPSGMPPELRFDQLNFSYPDGDRPALQGLSFTVPAGGTLGIVGPTGSGKTTLLRLVSRLYNPDPGQLLVDGVDVRSLDLMAWRDCTTLVRQKPFLFSESVAQNILLGSDDEAELARAVDIAALKPDMRGLPEGTDTLVGESGVMLSGGQRQRTALARGLIREHCLLMLDDVLSAVDTATEAELIASLQAGDHRPTTLIASNRLSAVAHADLVLVLDAGHMVDIGRPDELAQRPGLYKDMLDAQREAE